MAIWFCNLYFKVCCFYLSRTSEEWAVTPSRLHTEFKGRGGRDESLATLNCKPAGAGDGGGGGVVPETTAAWP